MISSSQQLPVHNSQREQDYSLAYGVNIHQNVSNIGDVRFMLQPLLELENRDEQEMYLSTNLNEKRSGRWRRMAAITFEVAQLRTTQIPTQNAVTLLCSSMYQVFMLVQHQCKPTEFDIYICHTNFCQAEKLQKALLEVVYNIGGSNKGDVRHIYFWPSLGKMKADSIRKRLLANTGLQMAHQLVTLWQNPPASPGNVSFPLGGGRSRGRQKVKSIASNSVSSTQMMSSNYGHDYQGGGGQLARVNSTQASSMVAAQDSARLPMGHVLLDGRGRVFDIHEFGRGCLTVLENLIVFTKSDLIRSLQVETNEQKRSYRMRLLDHRPLIQQAWIDTISFALETPQAQGVAEYFTQEQVTILYNSNRKAIMDTFNQFVLNSSERIVQPHPVRALLDNLPFLTSCGCFDMSWYNYRQCSLNWLVGSYFIAKNFLTDDYFLRSNMGAVCFNGVPGSGKSRICQVLHDFFNGFNYQDTKGGSITEFQNYDIVSKSFIRAEEVQLKKLSQSDWKMLADIEISLKCRIKNQPDVEVTKYVPVVITSNGSVYDELISKRYADPNVMAAHRRWGFVRYFETWNNAHPELLTNSQMIDPCYSELYSHSSVNHELMNFLVAAALTFQGHNFVHEEYIIPYYGHCLTKFSETLFGQVVLSNSKQFNQSVLAVIEQYASQTDAICFDYQCQQGRVFEEICTSFIRSKLVYLDDSLKMQLQKFLDDSQEVPLYFRCMTLCQDPLVRYKLKAQSREILLTFLSLSSCPLHQYVKVFLEGEHLLTDDGEYIEPEVEEVVSRTSSQMKEQRFPPVPFEDSADPFNVREEEMKFVQAMLSRHHLENPEDSFDQ